MTGIVVNVVLVAVIAVLFFLSMRHIIRDSGSGCSTCGSSGCAGCGSTGCRTNIEDLERLLESKRLGENGS